MQRTACAFLGVAMLTPAFADRVPIPLGDERFSNAALLNGVSATPEQCARIAGAVWAQVDGKPGECIRYWAAGLAGPRALVYIPPDQLAFDRPDAQYATRTPSQVQAIVASMQRSAGVPFIFLSRPGTFGSSGDHRERRRELEPRLMSAALDEIGRRHGITEWVLTGLSGGGHTVASLLAWRSDIVCAVAASAVSSPAMRWKRMGRTQDLTGFADSWEPVDQLEAGKFHPELRVFVLGDPRDSNVVWDTQQPLATRLAQLGVEAHLVTGEGNDPQRHALGHSARVLGSLCAKGTPTPEIMDTAGRGLKG